MNLAVVLFVEELFGFSRRSDDLSVNLASSLASIVSRVAVECRVDLAVQLAHVVSVKDGDLISFFFFSDGEVFIVAVDSSVGSSKFVKMFVHSITVSDSPFLVSNRIYHSLNEIIKKIF